MDAEWCSLDADPKTIEAIKEQKRQQILNFKPSPAPERTIQPSPRTASPAMPAVRDGSPRQSAPRPSPPVRLPAVEDSGVRQVAHWTPASPAPAALSKSDSTSAAGANSPRGREGDALWEPALFSDLKAEAINPPAQEPSLQLLGLVEDGHGETAALVQLPQGGVQLVRSGDALVVGRDQGERTVRVREITRRGLRVQDEHETSTVLFRR